uniref:Uncharacterized LOC109526000 n=1 Tax=Hippocampus comes TaxID=109280 RepID=A0A3Q2Z064_HIPCM
MWLYETAHLTSLVFFPICYTLMFTQKKGPSRFECVKHTKRCTTNMTRKRSVVWDYFNDVCPESVECLLCKNLLNKHEQGSTTGMWRHLRAQHPTEAAMAAKRESRGTSISSNHGQPLEIGEAQGTGRESAGAGVAEKKCKEEKIMVENPLSFRSKCHRRSSIWKLFEPLGSLDVAQCLICKKRIRCPDGKTSNMHRHMSKSHPQAYRQAGKALKLTKTNSPSHSSNVQQETYMVQVSKDTAAERRVFRRERELIEALRRTQREEAKALDHQRELVESLRAVNAREAAVEKKQIESLRRAQQEEAQDLMRQREELEREKTEQQKRWEELEQEKKQLLLLCQEPAAPTLVSHQQ